jgi:hypothetical protein
MTANRLVRADWSGDGVIWGRWVDPWAKKAITQSTSLLPRVRNVRPGDFPATPATDIAAELAEALRGVDVWLTDTLSGRVKPNPETYKQWLVDGIVEARNRARAALAKYEASQ